MFPHILVLDRVVAAAVGVPETTTSLAIDPWVVASVEVVLLKVPIDSSGRCIVQFLAAATTPGASCARSGYGENYGLWRVHRVTLIVALGVVLMTCIKWDALVGSVARVLSILVLLQKSHAVCCSISGGVGLLMGDILRI